MPKRFHLLVMLAFTVPAVAANIDFARDIRPILSDHCFACHGPDASKRKGELRLDIKDSAFGKAESGAVAIVPGDLEKSELAKRICASDPDDVMPPPKDSKQLKPEQIELLKQWVKEGANWTGHWSFQTVKPVEIPQAAVKNPIDAFVQARLAKEGLKPALEEDPARLLRRVSLDLTGLPPSVGEVDSFMAASAQDRDAALSAAVDKTAGIAAFW